MKKYFYRTNKLRCKVSTDEDGILLEIQIRKYLFFWFTEMKPTLLIEKKPSTLRPFIKRCFSLNMHHNKEYYLKSNFDLNKRINEEFESFTLEVYNKNIKQINAKELINSCSPI